MNILGRDFAARFAERFHGRLYPAVLTKSTPGTYDPADVAAGTRPTTIDYTCEGHAFSYDASYVDGELVKSTDYRVMILLGSIKPVDPSLSADGIFPEPGDTISIAAPGQSTPRTGAIIKIDTRTDAAITCQVGGLI